MLHVSIRAYGRLNDFLSSHRRHQPFDYDVMGNPSIKDLIESTGIPHPEIGLILVDGKPASLSLPAQDQTRISVYPPFRSIELTGLSGNGQGRRDEPRLVLDTHLGRLARYLRMLGLDTFYRNDFDDDTLEDIASREDRILLTQDVGLLKRSAIDRGYFVRASDPRRQLVEVAAEFDLLAWANPFQRCLRCNGMVAPVAKSQIEERLLPRTRAQFDEFYQCADCGTTYWKGSHYDRMRQIIGELERELADISSARREDND